MKNEAKENRILSIKSCSSWLISKCSINSETIINNSGNMSIKFHKSANCLEAP